MPTAGQVTSYDYQIHGGPISVYYAAGSGFLHTGAEPIGEAE